MPRIEPVTKKLAAIRRSEASVCYLLQEGTKFHFTIELALSKERGNENWMHPLNSKHLTHYKTICCKIKRTITDELTQGTGHRAVWTAAASGDDGVFVSVCNMAFGERQQKKRAARSGRPFTMIPSVLRPSSRQRPSASQPERRQQPSATSQRPCQPRTRPCRQPSPC